MVNRMLSDKRKQCIYPIAIYGFVIFFDYGDKHKSYVYSLTLCQPSHQELVCTLKRENRVFESASVVEKTQRPKEKNQKWPDKPKTAIYRQVHKLEENAP